MPLELARRLSRRVRAGAARGSARGGGDVRRAGRARRPPARSPGRRDVLRTLRPVAVRADAPRRLGGRPRSLRRSRPRVQAPTARARRSLALSLSEELRDELAAIAPTRRCCTLAELSALFHASGAWHLRGAGVAVELDLATPAAARRAFALLRGHGVRSEIRTYPRRAFDGATRYQLHVEVDGTAGETLVEAGVLSPAGAPLERPPKRVVGRSCCRTAYLRGALLGGGSLSGPRDPHLELRTSGRAGRSSSPRPPPARSSS